MAPAIRKAESLQRNLNLGITSTCGGGGGGGGGCNWGPGWLARRGRGTGALRFPADGEGV